MSSMDSPPVFHDEFKEQPSWPTYIGVLGCVWGGLTFVWNGCCQILPTVGGKLFFNMMPPEAQEQMKAQMAMVSTIDILFMFIMTFISILLLVSAILLLRRKPIAAKFHIAYGIIAVVVLLAHIAWGVSRADQVAQLMKQNAGMPNNPMANMGATMMIVMTVVMGIIRLVYPVFCLIWFGWVKKNADMGSNEVSL